MLVTYLSCSGTVFCAAVVKPARPPAWCRRPTAGKGTGQTRRLQQRPYAASDFLHPSRDGVIPAAPATLTRSRRDRRSTASQPRPAGRLPLGGKRPKHRMAVAQRHGHAPHCLAGEIKATALSNKVSRCERAVSSTGQSGRRGPFGPSSHTPVRTVPYTAVQAAMFRRRCRPCRFSRPRDLKKEAG